MYREERRAFTFWVQAFPILFGMPFGLVEAEQERDTASRNAVPLTVRGYSACDPLVQVSL